MKKIIAPLLIFLLFTISLSAQISEGGLPPSFTSNDTKSLSEIKSYKVEVNEDIDKLIREDLLLSDKNIPQRVAVVLPVNHDLARDGEWTTLSTGERVCRMTIKSPEALGIILSYSEFYIPKGGKLYIYSKNKYQLLGAYTHRTNPKGKEFSTEIVYGDELTLEYVGFNNTEAPRIIIADVGYAYNDIHNYTKTNVEGPGFNASGSCQVNINCEEGIDWQKQKKGVARTYTKIGIFWYCCSGSLINNTTEDRTAFFLSAYHCFFNSQDVANFNTIQFYFNYEFPECANEEIAPETTKSLIGAQLLVASPINGGTDGILLKLNDAIPNDYDVYFNGWDISNTAAQSGACIHHPSGDVKKISTFTSPLTTTTYSDSKSTSMPDAHWNVNFVATKNGYGSTEGGSSGSPLFNANGLIVGSLTGGSSSCTNQGGDDSFGKISYHWNKHQNPSYHIQPYLDPTNKVQKIDGLNNIPPTINENAPIAFAYWGSTGGARDKSSLTVKLSDDADILKKVTIVNIRGYNMFVKSGSFTNYLHAIDTSNWPRGVYIMYVDSKKGVKHSFKIIK